MPATKTAKDGGSSGRLGKVPASLHAKLKPAWRRASKAGMTVEELQELARLKAGTEGTPATTAKTVKPVAVAKPSIASPVVVESYKRNPEAIARWRGACNSVTPGHDVFEISVQAIDPKGGGCSEQVHAVRLAGPHGTLEHVCEHLAEAVGEIDRERIADLFFFRSGNRPKDIGQTKREEYAKNFGNREAVNVTVYIGANPSDSGDCSIGDTGDIALSFDVLGKRGMTLELVCDRLQKAFGLTDGEAAK